MKDYCVIAKLKLNAEQAAEEVTVLGVLFSGKFRI